MSNLSDEIECRIIEKMKEIRSILNDEKLSDADKAEKSSAAEAELDALRTQKKVELQTEATEKREQQQAAADNPDAELRERIELRRRAAERFADYFRDGRLEGAALELRQAAKVDHIPLEIWDVPPDAEQRAATAAPATVGINIQPLQPMVFAPSIAATWGGIEMPRVDSGTFASGTISTQVSASEVAKGADAPQTAAAFEMSTTVPHRISSSIKLQLEDIAAVGVSNFSSILMDHASMAMSAELDDLLLNGKAAVANQPVGLFERLTDPAAPGATVASWTDFLTVQASGIDGLWATQLSHIAMLVGPASYRLAATTFQGNDSEQSAASYMTTHGGGFVTNSRMPDAANKVQQGLIARRGRSGMQTAVCPQWGELVVDDPYTGGRSATREYSIHVLVGDVILTQPDAYAQISFRLEA